MSVRTVSQPTEPPRQAIIDTYFCLTTLHAPTLEYQHNDALRLMVDLQRQKGQLEKTAGSPSQRLVLQDSGGMPSLYCSIYAAEI